MLNNTKNKQTNRKRRNLIFAQEAISLCLPKFFTIQTTLTRLFRIQAFSASMFLLANYKNARYLFKIVSQKMVSWSIS
jgi:hypothetical protein